MSDHEQSVATPWLNVEQAARYLCMSEHALRHRLRRQQLPHYRLGGPRGSIRLHRAELDAYARGETT